MTRPSDETIKEVAAVLRTTGGLGDLSICSDLADRLDPPPHPIAVGDRVRILDRPEGVVIDRPALCVLYPDGSVDAAFADVMTRVEDGA